MFVQGVEITCLAATPLSRTRSDDSDCMQVTEINRYPLKSGAADTLNNGELTLTGLTFDRHWMVVTESGRFISQREKGAQKLSLVRALLGDEGLELFAPGKDPLIVPFESATPRRITVELHDEFYEGVDAGDEAAQWFSEFLPPWKNESFRLVYFPSNYVRSTKGRYTQLDSAVTQFADGYAVLITNEASLADLNQRLEAAGVDPVKMNVFRPNIVIGGGAAWAEDELKQLQIGDAIVEVVKPCGRCPITGVTQELGSFSRSPQEPRRTLEDFHAGKDLIAKFPNLEEQLLDKAMFGQNAVVIRPGAVRVGDEIKVLSTR
jgi:uncharacterized protein YcbX